MRLDIVLRGGLVIDGTGAPPFRGDVGISGGSIAAIGDLSGVPAERVVDVRGMVVCPGFIDIHNHSDISIFAVPTADNYVLQGVTTIVTGNCGLSPAPVTRENREFIRDSFRPYSAEITIGWRGFGEYLERLEALDKGVNVAPLVGHGTVRAAVMGLSDQRPGEDEMREMKRLVDEAMAAGAFGLSTGLVYVPGVFAATEEVAELARVSAERGGIYATHVRDEGEGLLDALAEAVAVARSSGAPLQVSHLKASGRANWGRVSAALALLEDLASRGFDVSADAYPYTAGATYLAALLPPWAREGGPREMARRLRDPGVVERLRRELAARGLLGEVGITWDDVVISYSEAHGDLAGLRLSEAARMLGTDPLGAVIKLLVDDEGATGMIVFTMSEDDVRTVVSHPLVAIGSDGLVVRKGVGKPHPRFYGTFPRILGRYVRELKLMSLPEAVRKMTSLPARKLGLWDRGLIRPGMAADIVAFDPRRVADRATYEDPEQPPEGIEYVIVNGGLVVEEGEHTGARPGRLLRRGGNAYIRGVG